MKPSSMKLILFISESCEQPHLERSKQYTVNGICIHFIRLLREGTRVHIKYAVFLHRFYLFITAYRPEVAQHTRELCLKLLGLPRRRT